MAEASWKTALKAKGAQTTWHCTVCENDNTNRDPKCTICYSPKPVQEAQNKPKEFKHKVQGDDDAKFTFDFNSESLDIERIDWGTAIGVEKSKGGSQGVYFVAFPAGAVVVKGSMGVAAEVFGATLGSQLGIFTHSCRIIPLFDNVNKDGEKIATGEGLAMYEKLVELDKKNLISGILRTDLLKSYLAVQSFHAGVPLGGVAVEDLVPFLGKPGALTEGGRARLKQLGQGLAYDMLIHNCDRLPLVVVNQGNGGNVIFCTSKGSDYGKPVFIDNAAMCIDPIKNLDTFGKYVEMCASLLRHIASSPNTPSTHVIRVKDCITDQTGFDIDKDASQNNPPGSIDIQHGVREFVSVVNESVTVKDLMQLKKQIASMCVFNKEDMVGLDNLRADYFHVMLSLFRAGGDLKGKSAEGFIREVLSSWKE